MRTTKKKILNWHKQALKLQRKGWQIYRATTRGLGFHRSTQRAGAFLFFYCTIKPNGTIVK